MKARHLILMLLKASKDKIESKTKLQKAIYFISLLLKSDLGFKAHYYGPYSAIVGQGLDELVGAGFVNERRDVFGIDASRGFELKRCEFSLTESGRKLAEILAKENPEEYRTISTFVEKLKETGNPNYLTMSIAAKTYFILDREGRTLTKEQIRSKAKELGWAVGEDDIGNAIEILKKLNFVKKGH